MSDILPGMGQKVVASVVLVIALVVAVSLLSMVLKAVMHKIEKAAFWTQQALRLVAIAVFLVGLGWIWAGEMSHMTTMAGVLTAGIAVALQRVITAFSGYLIILRGKLFTVGDRITIGGVRGDVVALGFMQTTVLEMGQAPGEQADPPATWVRSRQHTGRIVRITNDKIFDTPVYNYTREFQFLWEEIHLPIGMTEDRGRAEQILLDVAQSHTAEIIQQAEPQLANLRDTYSIHDELDVVPHVYYRIEDNFIELTLRFVSAVRETRPLKDAISRDILTKFGAADITIASGK